MNVFSVQMINLDLFFRLWKSLDIAMATDFVKKMANSPLSSIWHSETEWYIATSMCALTVQMMPVYCVKIMNVWYDMAKNWHILSYISGSAGPIITIFTSYESAFGADDKSGPYFPIWQRTLPC